MSKAQKTKKGPKRLYRSQEDKMIAGVCGGIAEYFNWDPVWVRLATVLLIFVNGLGLLMYIAAWIIVPKNPNQNNIVKDSNSAKTSKAMTPPPPKKHRGLLTTGIILGVLLLVLAAGVTAQFAFCVTGSGTVVQETRDAHGFDEVILASSGTLMVTEGENYTVIIETDDNLIEYYETKVIANKLEIGMDTFKCVRDTQGLTVYVTMPKIAELTMAGSGDIIGKNTLNADQLEVTIAGSGDIILDVNATQLETVIAGSGEAYYTGKANTHNIEIAGSGDIYAFGLETTNTSIEIAGSGDAEITVTEQLDIDIAGSGDIRYYGNPRISQDIAGSGDIQRME